MFVFTSLTYFVSFSLFQLPQKIGTSQLRELSRTKLFGRPGHGAPTENIKKKKFTEYQLDKEVKDMQSYANPYGDPEYNYGSGGGGGGGMAAEAQPPPPHDYRASVEPPRPQTYDAYERGRPSPINQDCNGQKSVRKFKTIFEFIPHVS